MHFPSSAQTKKLVVVGIADAKISSDPNDILVTYSLGSCIGLSLFDPVARLGGMLHSMLPLSKNMPEKAITNPYMYVDTGVIKLLQELFDRGAEKRRLIAILAGCSSKMDEKGLFKIGERNHTVMKKILWKNDILVRHEFIGGLCSRTMFLDIETGRTTIRTENSTFETEPCAGKIIPGRVKDEL